MITCSMPAATASSTAYWMIGLSTSSSISLGCALVAGRNRVPQPAAGKTAFRTRMKPLRKESGGSSQSSTGPFDGRSPAPPTDLLTAVAKAPADRDRRGECPWKRPARASPARPGPGVASGQSGLAVEAVLDREEGRLGPTGEPEL